MKNSVTLNLIVNNMFKDEFSFEDVSMLMYKTLLKNEHKKGSLEISKIGIISGFVDLNGELEVIVKFMDGVQQYTKEEFSEKLTMMNEGF